MAPLAPPGPSSPAAAPLPPPPPTSWNVSGLVLASNDGRPVGGATVALDGIAPVTAAPSGDYLVETPDASNRRLVVNADGYQYRETYLRGGEVRRNVVLDLIPNGASFPLWLYRQIARNGHEQPANLQPIKRWTTSPNIHLENRWRDTGVVIPDDILEYFVDEIRRVIPQLSDGRLAAGQIEIGPEVWNSVPGYISIHFDHSGNWGVLGQDPGQVQFGTAAKCTSIMIIHELGHAMGFWHSSVQGSVMGGHVLGSCDQMNLTPDERQVARVLYSRPPGNVEPDKDPPTSTAYLRSAGAAARVDCDDVLSR